MSKKIIFEPRKGFNQSSKIIAFKLGVNASIILSSLLYKHNYWFEKNRLMNIGDEFYFFITYLNIEGETLIKQSAIKKAIGKLKKAGLIKVERKGVPATNHYCLKEYAINAFEAKYEDEYLKWIEDLNSSGKRDRERFSTRDVIQVGEEDVASKNSSNIQTLNDKFIEDMRNSTLSETHESGLIY